MAKSEVLAPFILQAEGGFVNSKTDAGGETNKGITYKVWTSVFGNTPESHKRFLAMEPADWLKIFKPLYWDKVLGDDIISQRVANFIIDWVWGSGVYYPIHHIQVLLKMTSVDGAPGPNTLKAINAMDEPTFYEALIEERLNYYMALCAKDLATIKAQHPDVQDLSILARLAAQAEMQYLPNLKGWQNRVENLKNYNLKLAA